MNARLRPIRSDSAPIVSVATVAATALAATIAAITSGFPLIVS